MKIGIFTDSYPPYINGVSTSIENLRNALIKKGHIVYIVTLNNNFLKYDYNEDEKILRIPGIPTGIYNYRLGRIFSFYATKLIEKWNLDIIHTHTEFAIGTYARILSKMLNIPLIHTYHTLYEDYTHYITKGHLNKISKSFVKQFTRFYCEKTCKQAIVPTEKIKKLFVEKYNITNNIEVIPSGINIDNFLNKNISNRRLKKIKSKLNIKPNDFVILFVGRLAKEKNIEFILKAHKKLLKKYSNIKLVIVGDGPDKEDYINITRKLNTFDKVIFTGIISNKETKYYYHCADIFATASTSETQGLTVIEAMASSVVPICINDMAYNSMVPSDLLFYTEEEFMAKVSKFVENKELTRKNKIRVRELSQKFSAETYAENIFNVYEKVIKNFMKVNDNKIGERKKIKNYI